MARGFKHGTGGASALNFKVVGAAEAPANPKENMIWVNTDSEITGWIFSAIEPAEPTEGMVWIVTDTFSNVTFNALKKNALQVCPRYTRQYLNGVWTEKTPKIWKGDAWVDWADWDLLFDYGDENIPVTGGYVKSNESITITENSDGSWTFTWPYNVTTAVYTQKAVDLTDKTTLYFEGTITGNAQNQVGVWGNAPKDGAFVTVGISSAHANGTYAIDVSALTGTHYFGLRSYGGTGTTLKKAWLE